MHTQEQWYKLHAKRNSALQRYQRYAQLTLPTLFPDDTYPKTSDGEYLTPAKNSIGAQLVNNMANKLMLSLFAPSRPFFRLNPSEEFKQEFIEQAGRTQAELDQICAKMERQAISQFESLGIRPILFELLTNLVVTGNVLLRLRKNKFEIFTINDYVQSLTRDGKVLELIIKENLQYAELTDDVRAQLKDQHEETDMVKLFTHVRKQGDKWIETMSIDGQELQGKDYRGQYTESSFPYYPQFWSRTTNNNYGTGLVEQYAADFEYVDALTQAELDIALMSAAYRWTVNPASAMLKVEDLANSVNGDVLPASPDDINVLMTSRNVDMSAISGVLQEKTQRLATAFLLSNSLVRDAERVTAEEIRMVINELDTSLGGVHTRLAHELQMPIAIMLNKAAGMSDTSLKGFNPTIITGLDALSRNGDLEAKRTFFIDAANFAPAMQAFGDVLNTVSILRSMASDRGLDPEVMIKSDDQLAAEQQAAQEQAQQQQAMQMVQSMGAQNPELLQELADGQQ